MRDPVPYRAESFGDEVVTPLSAMPMLCHEPGIEQNTEVLRDGRPAHLEMSRNRVDGTVGLDKETEHPATRRMANCPKNIRLASGSHDHAVNLRKENLTRQVRSRPSRSGSAAPASLSTWLTAKRMCRSTCRGADVCSVKLLLQEVRIGPLS